MPREKKRRETEQGQEAQVPAGPLRGAAGENRDTGPVLRTPESIGLSPGRKAGGKRVRDAQVSRGDAISTTLADGDASQVENDPPEGENAEVRQDGNSDDAGEPAAKKAREESGQETAPAPEDSQNNADGEASDVQDPATVLAIPAASRTRSSGWGFRRSSPSPRGGLSSAGSTREGVA